MSKIFNIASVDESLGRIFSDFRNSNFKAHLLSLIEQIWELIWKFHIKYWLWRIKIDRFHGVSIKWGQKWKKFYELTFGSGEPFWELILKFQFKYWLWGIKIDRFQGLSIAFIRVGRCNLVSPRFSLFQSAVCMSVRKLPVTVVRARDLKFGSHCPRTLRKKIKFVFFQIFKGPFKPQKRWKTGKKP